MKKKKKKTFNTKIIKYAANGVEIAGKPKEESHTFMTDYLLDLFP